MCLGKSVLKMAYENAKNETRKTAENGKLTITANCRNLFGRLGQNVKIV
jgi:hypothetical protein